MKKNNLLILALILIVTNKIATAQNYDWIQTTLLITAAEYGTTGQSRIETTYDTEGKQIGYKHYSNGELLAQYRDYQYNGRTATYWFDSYSGGSLQSSFKKQTTYSDKNWIQSTLYITYAEDGTTEQSRGETTYDTEGRIIGSKHYSNGELSLHFRDYQYNGRTATYWYDSYYGGSLQLTFKIQATYKEVTNTSVIDDALVNSISIYPNPTKEKLIIETSDYKIENIEIYDINGKKILSSTKRTINISHFLTGTYFVTIKTDIGECIKKIIKE